MPNISIDQAMVADAQQQAADEADRQVSDELKKHAEYLTAEAAAALAAKRLGAVVPALDMGMFAAEVYNKYTIWETCKPAFDNAIAAIKRTKTKEEEIVGKSVSWTRAFNIYLGKEPFSDTSDTASAGDLGTGGADSSETAVSNGSHSGGGGVESPGAAYTGGEVPLGTILNGDAFGNTILVQFEGVVAKIEAVASAGGYPDPELEQQAENFEYFLLLAPASEGDHIEYCLNGITDFGERTLNPRNIESQYHDNIILQYDNMTAYQRDCQRIGDLIDRGYWAWDEAQMNKF